MSQKRRLCFFMLIFAFGNQIFTVMERVSININLFKLKNTGITELTGKSKVTKRCLVIPIDDNELYTSEKGVYLNLMAFPTDKVENQTHMIKQSFDKERLERMTEEERRAIPILGGIRKPKECLPESGESYQAPQQFSEAGAPGTQNDNVIDDLPF